MHRDSGAVVRRPAAHKLLNRAKAIPGRDSGWDVVAVSYGRDGAGLHRTIELNGGAHREWVSASWRADATNEGWDSLVLRGVVARRVSTVPNFTLRYGDLFAGCGGMSLGVEQAAHAVGGLAKSALAVDINEPVMDIYRSNIQCERAISGDIRGTVLPPIRESGKLDLLVGGPPCQGHSNLNNHTRRDDERNGLYMEMVRFALDYDVPVVVIENVPTVRWSKDSVVDWAGVVLRLAGYRVESLSIDASSIGVPQTRKRHFLLASKYEMPPICDFLDAFRTGERSVGWAIDDLLDADRSERIDVPANLSDVNRMRIQEMFEDDLYDMPMHLRPPSHQNGRYSYTSVYGRLRWDRPAGTITTNFRTPGCGRFIHPKRQRTLTMHEAARLQTFPDTFEFFPPGLQLSNQTVQTAIGNAVPPKLAFVVGLWAIAALGISAAGHGVNGYRGVEAMDQPAATVSRMAVPVRV